MVFSRGQIFAHLAVNSISTIMIYLFTHIIFRASNTLREMREYMYCAQISTFTVYKKVVIMPNPTHDLEWTVDIFDELIRAGIYMFLWGEAPSSGLFE